MASASDPAAPDFQSEIVRAGDAKRYVDISVDITDARELHLIANDGDNGIGHDWVAWLEPRLVGPAGVLPLTELKWRQASSDWGRVALNANPKGKPIRVDGARPAYAIGTHANSIISWRIPKGYDRFLGRAALDHGGGKAAESNASVRFAVTTQFPPEGLRVGQAVMTIRPLDHLPTEMLGVPDDLVVTLWAKSPMLHNPTNIDVDARGRVWVAEGMNYRGSILRPGGDQIVVLADSTGDGQADEKRVFVQDPSLVAPLGIAVIDNQIVVSQPPHLIVYTDVDRNLLFDPAVDTRIELLSGFEGKNHDHSLHSVTVGPDGWWYFNCGNMGGEIADTDGRVFRIGSFYNKPGLARMTSDDGNRYFGGTAFRMRPNGKSLTPIGHNFRNSYEQTVTASGDVFQNDNDDQIGARTTWLMPFGNAGYADRSGLRKWQADRRPLQDTVSAHWRQLDPGVMPAGDVYGGGSPTGIVYNESSGLGTAYRNMLISCDSARNSVYGYRTIPDGAGYKLVRSTLLNSNPKGNYSGVDFSRSSHDGRGNDTQTYFRPSDAAIGIDGALYVADWFDPRVGGHGTRDKVGSGAIYRIAPKKKGGATPIIDFSTIPGLVEALKSPAVNVRGHAVERLVRHGHDAVSPLRDFATDAVEPEFRARALWPLVQLGDGAWVAYWTLSADPVVRIAAFRAIARFAPELLAGVIAEFKEWTPEIRREIAISLMDRDFSQANKAVLLRLGQELNHKDRWEVEAFGLACRGKESAVYGFLQPQLGPNPESWSLTFSRIAWRLHPVEAMEHFFQRAQKRDLPEADRLLAVDGLAFVESAEAESVMVKLRNNTAGAVRAAAIWWLDQRRVSGWTAKQ